MVDSLGNIPPVNPNVTKTPVKEKPATRDEGHKNKREREVEDEVSIESEKKPADKPPIPIPPHGLDIEA